MFHTESVMEAEIGNGRSQACGGCDVGERITRPYPLKKPRNSNPQSCFDSTYFVLDNCFVRYFLSTRPT